MKSLALYTRGCLRASLSNCSLLYVIKMRCWLILFKLAIVSSRTWHNMIRNRHALLTQVRPTFRRHMLP